MGSSILDIYIEQSLNRFFASDEFKAHMDECVRWCIQGFENGLEIADRRAFTKTVAKRIRSKARRRIKLLGGLSLKWFLPSEECYREADEAVTDFLRSERIKFGNAAYYWKDGADIADEWMREWEPA